MPKGNIVCSSLTKVFRKGFSEFWKVDEKSKKSNQFLSYCLLQ